MGKGVPADSAGVLRHLGERHGHAHQLAIPRPRLHRAGLVPHAVRREAQEWFGGDEL